MCTVSFNNNNNSEFGDGKIILSYVRTYSGGCDIRSSCKSIDTRMMVASGT